MRLVQLKSDDDRFGHKAGDLFIVEDADYDSDKVVGVKVEVTLMANSFYKYQVKKGSMPGLIKFADKKYDELTTRNAQVCYERGVNA